MSPGPLKAPSLNKGVYHKVQSGETLWRIAKTYSVDIGSIVKINNIPNVAKIEKDQLVFIPGATEVKDVQGVVPSGKLEGDANSSEFIWPVKGKVISYFGERQRLRVNRGISIEATEGEIVRAARAGVVVFADYLAGYVYTVILDHEDGLFSVYSQNAKLLATVGTRVAKNGPIAHVGRNQGIAFLHFEIRKNSIADNPLYYLP